VLQFRIKKSIFYLILTNIIIVPCQWIWLVFLPIPYFAKYSALFMQTGRTLQGKHIDAVGPYSFKISDCIMYEFLWHFLTVISKILSREFPSNIHSMVFLYPRWRAKSHIQKQCYVRNAVKYSCFVAYFFPHASVDAWLRQNRCAWPATISRYGHQHTGCDHINPNYDGV